MKTSGFVRVLMPAIVLVLTGGILANQQPQQPPPGGPQRPTLTVSGDAEVAATPDLAIVQLGAVAQAEQANAAQDQVNQIVSKALEAIKASGVASDQLQTSGISLSPVYSQAPINPRDPNAMQEPRIVGYRASNVIQVRLKDLGKVGTVIDLGVKSGANQVQGIQFQLQDDTEVRSQALKQAVQNARAKADAIAQAAGVQIDGLKQISEGGVQIMTPQLGRAMMRMEAGASTPVEPGQVRIHASVTVEYLISEGK